LGVASRGQGWLRGVRGGFAGSGPVFGFWGQDVSWGQTPPIRSNLPPFRGWGRFTHGLIHLRAGPLRGLTRGWPSFAAHDFLEKNSDIPAISATFSPRVQIISVRAYRRVPAGWPAEPGQPARTALHRIEELHHDHAGED
jgi:hypothetical protein